MAARYIESARTLELVMRPSLSDPRAREGRRLMRYQAGDYIRVIDPALSTCSHPFSISSSPQEETVSLHIRVAGPFTQALVDKYASPRASDEPNTDLMVAKPLPTLRVVGPFGSPMSKWPSYDVCVMIAGGIGVTPFISAARDCALKTMLLRRHNFRAGGDRAGGDYAVQRAHLLWLAPNQATFDSLRPALEDLERLDADEVLQLDFAITRAKSSGDARVLMLRAVDKLDKEGGSGGLMNFRRANLHFGSFKGEQIMRYLADAVESAGAELQLEGGRKPRIAVQTCGPTPMTAAVWSSARSLQQQGHFLDVFEDIF